jgi:hypothetical protein
MEKLIHIILKLSTVILMLGLFALFFWPPALGIVHPLACPQNTTLAIEASPYHFKNVVFNCIGTSGERTDATIPLFRSLCFGVVIPYIVGAAILTTILAAKKRLSNNS